MKTTFGAVSMTALLLITPACSQQVTPSGSNAFSAQDQKFLTVIGQSTLAEVALGKLAAEKGTTPAVRLFGRWMASTDSLANRQLATMLEEMHGPTLPTAPTAEQQAEFQNMRRLSGAEFDQEYIQMMVPGHNAEIALFEEEAQNGQNQSVRSFARNLLPTAKEHLAAVQDLIATTTVK